MHRFAMRIPALIQRVAPALALLALGTALSPAAAAERASKPAPVTGAYDEGLFQAMDFRLVGPFRGGRSTAVAGVPGQPRTFYMGTTGGGVWKTTDGGATWRNVSDRVREEKPYTPPTVMGDVAPGSALSEFFQEPPPQPPAPTRERAGDGFRTASVGAIAVAPSDPNVVYVGMGSACLRGNVSPGDGVYKSTDAGESWHRVGLADTQHIAKIRVHPKDPNVVYVAAMGHAFGTNAERGVFRSSDGGRTWRKVLYVGDKAGAVDLVMDASNPRVLYAATYESLRQPWTAISGGPASAIYKSIDGGDTWRKLSEGLPDGTLGRIGLALSPANPNRLWALVEAKEKWGVYRSDDGGKSFRLLSPDRNLIQRAWYYTHIYADPKDASTVYILNTSMFRSEDGGKTFTPIRTPHGDNHDLWISPDDPQVMIESNDGGANVTYNGGRNWSTQANQPTAELYRLAVDDQFPYWLYSGQQDNSAVAIPSRSMDGNIDRQHWYIPGGCESAHVAVDPRNPDITYAGCYGGSIGRYDRKLGHEEDVSPWPQAGVGQQAKDLRYRFQWNQPIRISPHDPQVLYTTSQVVHRSRDEGKSWEVVSPDLTRNDPAKQGYAGGPLNWDNTGVEVYDTIFAFEESPLTPGELWAGSDDGLVHVSRDNGANWVNVTPKGMPEWATVNSIELSRRQAGRAYVAAHRYRLDDRHPYIFRTDDYGKTWQLLTDGSNGIPADQWVRVVREDPERPGLLFAGTEFGLFVSFDAGRRWQRLQLDLPVAPVADLAVKDGDLAIATHGRSFWVLDDLSPLRQMTPDVAQSGRHLFQPRDAVRLLNRGGGGGGGTPVGENPPYGATIFYLLPENLEGDGKTEVKLEILDPEGKVIRTLSSQKEEPAAPNPFLRFFPELARPRKIAAQKGLNRYNWDLQLPDAFVVPDAVLWGSPSGPVVPPGKYQVRMTVGDWTSTQPLAVVADPRKTVAPDAFAKQYEVARGAWEALTRTHRAIERVRDVKSQVDALAKRMKDAGMDDGVADAAKALSGKLDTIENALHQPKSQAGQDILNYPPQLDDQIANLLGTVGSAEARPTRGTEELLAELQQKLTQRLAEIDQVIATDLPAFEKLVRDKQAPAIIVPKEKPAGGSTR